MGLFGIGSTQKYLHEMETAYTEEEIAEMEKQGYDVSSIRATCAEKEATAQAGEEAFCAQRKATAVETDLSKLTAYQSTPRSTDSEFFKDVAGKAPLFGKDKWKEKIATAPLIYGAVVQANSDLWLPGINEFYPVVLVFALDGAHMYDVEWLGEMAEKISAMKESSQVPADCQEFIDVLRDDQSIFCFPLASSLAGRAEAWCVTYKFENQTILPGNRLPEDGIVPFLLDEKPKKQMLTQLRPVPGKYYQA